MSDVFVALDLEATGMNPARHEVIEIALVAFSRERVLDRFDSLVRPGGRLSLDIATLTGIAEADLRQAPPWAEVEPAVRRFVAGRPLVGQSPQLDLAMLAAAGLRLPNTVYDTHELATLVLPELPAYNLGTIAAALGIAPPVGHRASADAEITAAVFQALLTRLDRYDPSTRRQIATNARLGGWAVADLFDRGAADYEAAGPLFGDAGDAQTVPHEMAFLEARERVEPLRPTGSSRSVEPKGIKAALAADGPFAGVVAGYERRPQQEKMAVAVGRTLSEDGRLLVEAGTGTGKSLAYLLPAALHAVERGEPVVISTNTLALQDQLYRKDVPDVRAALGAELGDEFRATVLKGRANYLCLRRWFAWLRQPSLDPAEARLRAKVLAWLGETTTGDRAELRLTADEDASWRHIAEEEGTCVPARCPFQQRNQCFLYRARREAERAHLVIVNHALLLSDVVAGSRVLPEYEYLVVDEAHHLEDQATSQFGYSVGERDVAQHLDAVVRTDGALTAGTLATATMYLARTATTDAERRRAESAAERLKAADELARGARLATSRLFARLLDVVSGGQGGFDRSRRLTTAARHDRVWADVEEQWEPLEGALRGLDDHLRWFIQALEAIEAAGGEDEGDELQRDELGVQLGVSIRDGVELVVRIGAVIATPAADVVYWVERSPVADRATLHAAPLDVGTVLREDLFDPLRGVVLTSATITTDGSFDFVADRLGLEQPTELMVPSPFDYERTTLLYLADDIPEPNAPAYASRLHETLIETCAATNGRALVLFTSHAALGQAARAMKGPLEERGVVVLAQRIDGSPRQLIERLRLSPNVVVLGTATFWEGVDVVGPALSLLVITKLPFSVPSDPVFAARSELFDNPFGQYAVPQAVLRFKQGFGRLIRSSHDRGVCAVLDRRVLTKRYGASFVQSLPECSVEVGSVYDLPASAAGWIGRAG